MRDPTLLRAAGLYAPLSLTALLWLWRAPPPRVRAAAVLATLWNLPALLAVHALAARAGWWRFDVTSGALAGFPVELYLGWAVLWGALPTIALARQSLGSVVALALLIDLAFMPTLSPVLRLSDGWLVGEAIAIVVCLVPARLLARWTMDNRHVGRRAALQAITFAGLLLGVATQAILQTTGGSWQPLLTRPGWITGLLAQLVVVAAVPGLSAVQEFAERGGGTPVPFDPPRRLVATGPYAYVRNPMQLSAALVLLLWGVMLESWWIAGGAVIAVIYGAGFAWADEGADLARRWGDRWAAYAGAVRSWLPRWRPLDPSLLEALGGDRAPAVPPAGGRLYVAEECGPCSEVRRWFDQRAPVGLAIVAAERHPTRSLSRITYAPADGAPEEEGVAAIGRALEHVNFGWALLGMFVRLPGVRPMLQLLTDASGGEPRAVVRYCDRPGVTEA